MDNWLSAEEYETFRCSERLLPAEAEVMEGSPAPDAEGVMGSIVDLRRY